MMDSVSMFKLLYYSTSFTCDGRSTTAMVVLFFWFDAQEVEIFMDERYPATRTIDRVMWDFYPPNPLPWSDSTVKAKLDVKAKTSKQCTRMQCAKFGDFALRRYAFLWGCSTFIPVRKHTALILKKLHFVALSTAGVVKPRQPRQSRLWQPLASLRYWPC
ncbi:hypothetical protein EVAR_20726_1 [Eumeta japonica]|uniref:Uncharacterized protein n=1 Tax=Eumeta variegata TaxID=151549 RepID=A0A4C1V9E4_EUMVA|nr:hypothetical protein EVAR_20726_1 [Eumeta japonica]